MTGSGRYISVNKEYGVFVGRGEGIRRLKAEGGSYLGFGKLFNLALSPDGNILLTAGFGSPYDAEWDFIEEQREVGYKDLVAVTLWDLERLRPLAKLPGNIAKTHATFSPDGKYVVSGSENAVVIVWDAKNKKERFRLASLAHGVIVNPNEPWQKWKYDKTGLIEKPKDHTGSSVLALKFIDTANHYLRFNNLQHYAILYSIDSPLPLKYLDLGTKPFPATRDYSRNTAIDTAPAAGILVTGQAAGPGINVYKYDKATQTLKRIWVAR